jgi:hypothetical protein
MALSLFPWRGWVWLVNSPTRSAVYVAVDLDRFSYLAAIGDGKASRRIADVLRSCFLNRPRVKSLEPGLPGSDEERPPCAESSAS